MTSQILLLHAFPLAPEMFDELRAELKAPIHTPALPGFGGAELNQEPADMSVLARSVLAYADEHGIDRFIVGGVSLGGYVVMELMRIAPERLVAAMLIDTKAGQDALEGRINRERIARLALRYGTNSLLGAMLPPLTGKTTKIDRPQVFSRVSEIFSKADPAAIAWTQRAMVSRPDSISTLQKFTSPLLVVVGDEDEISPIADAREMADAAIHGELAIIHEAGHLAVMERPSECARVLDEWLSRI